MSELEITGKIAQSQAKTEDLKIQITAIQERLKNAHSYKEQLTSKISQNDKIIIKLEQELISTSNKFVNIVDEMNIEVQKISEN